MIALASVTLAFAACGDDDDNDSTDGSPASSTSGSPSPSETAGGESPGASPGTTDVATITPAPTAATPSGPTPVTPKLDAGVNQIGEGTITFTLLPNGQLPIDGLGLIQAGKETPPCAAFVFAFSWQITNPFPVGDNTVAWKMTQQGSTEDVAAGPAGTATVGCGQLTVINTGPDQVNVAVHYIQGATQ